MESKFYRGPRATYSEEVREDVVRKLESGEYYSCYHASKMTGISKSQIRTWFIRYGTGIQSIGSERTTTVRKTEKKQFQIVEPVPKSFSSEKEKAEYFMLRAYYLEELFKLSDFDEDTKKKALAQLEQRLRERLENGDTSVY